MKESFPAVWVEWKDACVSSGWHSPARMQVFIESGLLHAKTLGWLINETDDVYTIAMTYTEEQLGDLINIPKSWVEEVRVLSE